MKSVKTNPLYYDGLHYDAQYGDMLDDLEFYLRQIGRYGEPVLELACGTGRLTIPIARKGSAITGLDINASMLVQAKRKAKKSGVKIELIKADCRDFELRRRFNLIFLPFNSIGHIHDPKDIESCFSSVRRHLKPEGRFIIDVFNPLLEILVRDSSKRYPVRKYVDPYGKGRIITTESNKYDKATQINRIKWYFKFNDRKKEVVEDLNLRIFFPRELDALVYYNGFEIEAKYGNYKEESFNSDSGKQLLVCRKRK